MDPCETSEKKVFRTYYLNKKYWKQEKKISRLQTRHGQPMEGHSAGFRANHISSIYALYEGRGRPENITNVLFLSLLFELRRITIFFCDPTSPFLFPTIPGSTVLRHLHLPAPHILLHPLPLFPHRTIDKSLHLPEQG